MKVFLSWSGEPSRRVAAVFREWLPILVQHAKPWMSSIDLDPGERWASEIAVELGDSTAGIAFVTQANQSSPWLVFESGALAGALGVGRLIPVLVDLENSQLRAPLNQFQSRRLDRDGVFDLVAAISRLGESEGLSTERLELLFDPVWPTIDAAISEAMESSREAGGEPAPDLSSDQILEQLVIEVRSLPSRLESLLNQPTASGATRRIDLTDRGENRSLGYLRLLHKLRVGQLEPADDLRVAAGALEDGPARDALELAEEILLRAALRARSPDPDPDQEP